MRTWGRQTINGVKTWVEISTDANGNNDYVWLETLIQCIKLNLGESPFWSNYGIPVQQSIVTQVIPDYYMLLLQEQFSQYFAKLSIVRTGSNPPLYEISAMTNNGVIIPAVVTSGGVPQ